MTEPASSTINQDAKIKIDILLKEYDTLRTEIIHRINNRWRATGFGIAAVALVGSLSALDKQLVTLIVVASALALLALWSRSWYLIQRCELRIAEIEQRVNEIAGERLLVWETMHTHILRNYSAKASSSPTQPLTATTNR